jgi:hypothetical protein
VAVLGRLLVSSAERLDLPDLLSLDSYAAGDWKYFLKGLVGDTKPYILKGFDLIDPANAIGTQSCSIRVADSVMFYPGSNSGSFFHGLQEGHPQAAPLVPELRKNAVNYVYLTFSTFNTSVDTRAFWDPDKDGGVGGEFTQDVNTESVLKVDINVSTGSFPANTVPVAKITVGPVVITAIEDARDMMYRLGSGGINPNPFNTYAWRSQPGSQYARQEPPTQMLAGGVNPFQGADKNILTLKEWMDAIMSKLRELGGTTYWYDDTSSFSIISNFYDSVATAFKSKGKWVHDTITPGLLTWTEDIQIKLTSDPRTYIVRQGSKTLTDEQVMYIPMQRNLQFNVTDENVAWINGQSYVNTIGGAVGLFANLSKGDYIKKANDTIDKWIRVEEFYDAVNLGGSTTTAANARSVRLSSAYLGVTGAEKGRYDKGSYLPADLVVSDRNQAAISNTGGQFHWLAIRSDTIENVGNAVTTSLSLAIDQHDGSTARVTATAHGLVDGDRITISGTTNFNGTYKVEVETANIFYINKTGGPFADESGTGRYATITTTARSTPYGFQEESANHGFNTDDTIIIADTTNFNGNYQISVRSSTVFTIPMASAAATETVGTARLAKVIVRTEGAVAQIIQGQVIDIGGSIADNIRQYIGMASLSETAPTYAVPVGYNTLDGMANYNGTVNESLTSRISKLTSMMADKAQDKTIKYLASNGIQSISNTTNGSAQELRFLPDGASLTLATPGSDGQAFVALPGSATPLSLLANQAAYVQIDRNNTTSPTIQVASLATTPIDENTFVLAVRINTNDIYIWDGSIIVVGSQPAPGYLNTVVRQNQALKLVAGGTWAWNSGTGTLSWSANAAVQVPGLANSVNTILAGSIVLTAGQVAYVDINRVGPGGNLTVTAALNSTLTMTTDRLIIAREAGGDVIVGAHSMRLIGGESKKLYAGASIQNLAFIGATDESSSVPDYSSNNYVVDGTSLLTAISTLDSNLGTVAGSIRWKQPVANFAALPASGNLDGDVRLTLDTRIAYSWNTATTDWRPLNSTGGGIALTGGGTVSLATNTLAWSAPMFLEIKGLSFSDNTIATGNAVFASNGQVAYVIPNLVTGGPTLTVTVAALSAVPLNAVVIARRDDPGVILDRTRLISGESKPLGAGQSNQALSFTGQDDRADATPDYGVAVPHTLRYITENTSLETATSQLDNQVDRLFGQLRLRQTTVADQSVSLTGVDTSVLDGTNLAQQLKSLLLNFTGGTINFQTGTPSVGSSFTAGSTIALNQFRWYSVTLLPSTVGADNRITGQILVIPAASDGASALLAPRAAFGSSGIKIGQVVVHNSGVANVISPVLQSDIYQLGSGSGGGGDGTGDANELLERLKDRLVEAPFEWATANIFSMDADTKVSSATATYDIANTLYKFTGAGQNVVSIQSLDAEYLTEQKDVTSVELMAFWNAGFIDSNATYEVSRNGGVNWQAVTMTRVGTTTDTFRGILAFPQDTSWITLHEWAVANATAYREINITALQAISQRFDIAASTEENLQQVVLYINRVGTPVGQTYAQLIKDDGTGKPSTNALDIYAQAVVQNSSLTAGDNAVTLTWGTNVFPTGTYHFVISTDSNYKAGFSAGVNSVRARVDGTPPIGAFGINELNAGVWTANAAQTMIHTVQGRALDLRVRITSSASNVQLKGYGVLYGRQDQVVTGIKNREVQQFNGTTNNFNTFTLTNFLPDPDLLKVYHVETGQVYMYGTNGFSLNGYQVVFPANTFNGLDTVTLVFDQLAGTSFDNSDQNAALLAANFLGSTNASIDRSQNGRGIFLRRPDGTLREITIDNNDNIAVYSV